MNDASRPAERETSQERPARDRPDAEARRAEEWRQWRMFGIGLAFIVFMLVVIAVSL